MTNCVDCGKECCTHPIEIMTVGGEDSKVVHLCQECLESVGMWCPQHGVHPYIQLLDEKGERWFSTCRECIRAQIAVMTGEDLQNYYELIKGNNSSFFEKYLTTDSSEYQEGPYKEQESLMYFVLHFAKIRQIATVEEAVSRLVQEGSGCSRLIQ